jgi:hypothetical protein
MEHEVACHAFLQATLEVELVPFTQNNHYLEATTEKWLTKYKDLRSGKSHESPSFEPPSKKQKRSDPNNTILPPPSPAVTINTGAFSFRCKPPSAARQTSTAIACDDSLSDPDQEQPAGSMVRNTPQAQSNPAVGTFSDPEKFANAFAALAELGYTGLSKEDLGKLNPSDEYETELKVMAEVRGYFQVAYKVSIQFLSSWKG